MAFFHIWRMIIMTVIYNNIPANTATVIDHVVTGCENQILFRASNWGTTVVEVKSYSVNDPTQKTWFEFSAAGNNSDWCIPCVSVGEVYQFTVLTPDVLTTELFVEILEQGCCCTSGTTPCFEIPIKFTQCA